MPKRCLPGKQPLIVVGSSDSAIGGLGQGMNFDILSDQSFAMPGGKSLFDVILLLIALAGNVHYAWDQRRITFEAKKAYGEGM